ncbi:FkbM family methyltransferase [Synechococcus sp. CS-1325]|uniref:FkbM family methyltransferase n=1 Tax=unclassified Synechococcus TaxID=2626047 RepID=UPI0021A3FE7B|nr:MULTISPECIES: FkbM family methyltransferase [unclassified Synechococcus]MCT0200801.1 FkbM family methyltransferase [Synechococcus sp. CS-1325]MCT0213840.1 FkbM family methyltransferase [Synechococcus sp. CS-1326]MCT0233416.1 FkbM family methyltransferase [Synechococcus sp. CS-1327]
MINQGYESRFDAAMMDSLEPGQCVFDIGANVGYYTKKFADRVGPTGSVHAFEPVPASAAMISELVPTRPWIYVHQCAIADEPGELVMEVGADSTSPTNKVMIGKAEAAEAVLITSVETIDSMATKVGLPAAIKIDVEGYELHVIKGGCMTLTDPALRHVFVEVHFSLLERRGLPNAPAEIQRHLIESGFQVVFTDFSHIHAHRV